MSREAGQSAWLVSLRRAACALSLTLGAGAGAQLHGPVANPEHGPVDVAHAATPAAEDAAGAGERMARAEERLPIGSAAASRTERAASAAGGASGGASDGGWALRTIGALTITLGAIFATRWGLRKLAVSGGLAGQLGAGGRAPSGVLEVMARYPVGRGQTLVLLRMDRRVLLLSQTSQGFSTLAEVTDAEEVASLIVRTRDEEGESLSSRFAGVLRSMERDEAVVEGVRTIDLTRSSGAESASASVRRRLRLLRGEAA